MAFLLDFSESLRRYERRELVGLGPARLDPTDICAAFSNKQITKAWHYFLPIPSGLKFPPNVSTKRRATNILQLTGPGPVTSEKLLNKKLSDSEGTMELEPQTIIIVQIRQASVISNRMLMSLQHKVEVMGGYRIRGLSSESLEDIQLGLNECAFDGISLNPYQDWFGNVQDLKSLAAPLKALVVPYGDLIKFDPEILAIHPEIEYLLLAEYSGSILIRSDRLKTLRVQVTRKMRFGQLPALTELFLNPLKSTLHDIAGLCPSLESLELSNGPLNDLSGIESFSRLRRIELSYLRKLRSVKHLSGLEELEELMVRATKGVTDLVETLGNLESLKVLKLWDAGVLDSLDFVSRLQLRELRCVGSKFKNHKSPALDRIAVVVFG